MADSTNANAACNLVAIDIARYSNAVLIETAVGKRHRFRMANTAPDFDRLLQFLHGLRGTSRVALEPTGDYHRPLAHRCNDPAVSAQVRLLRQIFPPGFSCPKPGAAGGGCKS